jgi:hypothetical protein
MTILELRSNIKRITAVEKSHLPSPGMDRAEFSKRATQLSIERVALWRELWQKDANEANKLSQELFG